MKTQNGDDIKAALIYDFDGTLAEGNCAEHGLLPKLGITNANNFWDRVTKETETRDADEILTYLGSLALQARLVKKREELTPDKLKLHGATIPLFPGVLTWFDRINKYAKKLDVQLEHYIVSSGIEEMILGTPIAKYFTRIFGCKYHYDKRSGYVKWPAVSINYTTKTQYIFRINKSVLNYYDDAKVNEYIEHDQRPLPFERMIYLGDGDTDIPCMRLVKDQGGCSIAVFDEKKWEQASSQNKIEKLIAEDRVNYVVPGNYNKESQLDVTVKGVLRKISRRYKT
ncbi:MAG: haloacid dehalogenase-like hydrolase [Nitrospirota bacterium]|nr:haloacid dehalogenase-like hydrolase [Nitrospirota bacterium]